MLDPLSRMSISRDWHERASAARIVARQEAGASEMMVLRLLRDTGSTAVTSAMAAALLDARREAAIPLILRALGQDIPTDTTARDHFDEASQFLMESLLESELDDVEVRGTIVSVLLDTDDRHELIGALEAIGWMAPSGGFPASPATLAHVRELTEHPDELTRGLAREALTALG